MGAGEHPGATYSIEIDAHGAVNSRVGRTIFPELCSVCHGLTGTSFSHNFVGAQPGRWRVRAEDRRQVLRVELLVLFPFYHLGSIHSA